MSLYNIVYIGTEYDSSKAVLVLNGVLCDGHRESLSALNDRTEIILHDDHCGNIPNCKSMNSSISGSR